MKNRDPRQIVQDILTIIDRIESYIVGMDFEQFLTNSLVVDAVVRNLEIIGIAVSQLPDEFCDRYPDIPWRQAIGLRNRLAHDYLETDFSIVWGIITQNLPDLKNQLRSI